MADCRWNQRVGACFALFLFAGAAAGQEFRGRISGRVVDPAAAAVPGAVVTANALDTGVTAKSKANAEGNYDIPYLLPGKYKVEVQASGFKSLTQSPVEVVINQTVTLNFTLQIGATSETITVTAQSPLLDTTNADLGQVMNKTLVDNVAVSLNRNAVEMAQLAGVTGSVGNSYTSSSQSNISIAGGGDRQGANEYLIDGVPNTSVVQNGAIAYVPSLDSVQEVKVQTTMFDAAYSHSNGGAISITTRGGTNQVHGSAYLFARFTDLNANTWTNNLTGTARPNTNYRQWGGIIGGPVWIPKIYDGHNRTFFTFSIERDRNPSSGTQLGRMPTALERQGDFSQTLSPAGSPLQIYNPFTTVLDSSGKASRQPFPGARIPANMLSPFGAAVLGLMPPPNYNTGQPAQIGAYNYVGSDPEVLRNNQWSVRGDHNFSANNRMFARVSHMSRNDDISEFFPGDWSLTGANTLGLSTRGYDSVTFDDTHVFSPTFVGSFRYGIGRRTDKDTEGGAGMDPSVLNLPSVILQNSTVTGFPFIRLRGNTSTSGNSDTVENLPWIGSRFNRDGGTTHSFLVNMTKVLGNHVLKFGGDYRLVRYGVDNRGDAAAGDFNFNPVFTQSNPFDNNTEKTSGTAMASLLLGIPSSGSFGSNSGYALQSHYIAGFIQDEWKISGKLTLNVGLRYEVETPFSERYNHIAYGFDPNAALPVQVPGMALRGGLVFAGQNGAPDRQGNIDWNNFGPRFGFAYNIAAKTVIRGGYGLFYASGVNDLGFAGQIDTFNAATTYVGSLDGGATPFTTISNPFPNGLSAAVGTSQGLLTKIGDSLTFLNPNRLLPYTQQIAVSVQRELPFATLVEAGYLHSLTAKEYDSFNLDEKPDAYLPLGSAENTQVPNPFFGIFPASSPLGGSKTIAQGKLWPAYPQFNSLTEQGVNTGMSTYNAFRLRVEKRLSRGLTFTGIYIFSRMTDNNVSSLINPRPYASIGSLDQTHVGRVAFSYDLPAQFREPGMGYSVLRQVAGGWRLSGYWSVATGLPLSISDSNGRPDLIGDPSTSGSIYGRLGNGPIDPATGYRVNPYINPSAFQSLASKYVIPTALPYYDDLRAPRTDSLNLSAFKSFRLWREGARMELRLDAQNAFNHPLFGSPSTALNNKSTFGVITSAGGNRLVEAGLRFAF